MTNASTSEHGDYADAIEFALHHNDDICQTYEFLKAWSEGALDEWPDFYIWLDGRAASLKEAAPAMTREAVELRSEVLAFACLMERQLRANDHKPGWKNDSPYALHHRLEQESKELWHAFAQGGDIGVEAADVANFGMMVADVCGALSALTTIAKQETDSVREAWQPISTAPKDGTRFLIVDAMGTSDIGFWHHDHACGDGYGAGPWTHWQPLPTPPAALSTDPTS